MRQLKRHLQIKGLGFFDRPYLKETGDSELKTGTKVGIQYVLSLNGLRQQQTIPKFLNFTKCILSFSVVTAKMLTWTVQIRLLVLSDCSIYINPTTGSLPVASTHPQ